MVIYFSQNLYKMYCSICQKTVKQKMKPHLDEHRQAATFRCSSCDKSNKYKSSLNQYERVWHEKHFFQCDRRSYLKLLSRRNGLFNIALKHSVQKVILQGTVIHIVKTKNIGKLNCLSV